MKCRPLIVSYNIDNNRSKREKAEQIQTQICNQSDSNLFLQLQLHQLKVNLWTFPKDNHTSLVVD